MTRHVPAAAIAAFLFVQSLSAQSPAEKLLTEAGMQAGLCCVIDNGALALAIARESGFLVHSLHRNTADAKRAREAAMTAGVLGRSLYVGEIADDALPFADYHVDLAVVAPDSGVQRLEIERVLSPARGKAVFLRDDGAISDTFKRPPLTGADAWTHRLHGPDNNPVSEDAEFTMPAMLQSLGLPMQTSFQGTMLVADGLRIELSDWVTKKGDRAGVAGILLARNLYNGLIVWQRALPEGIEPDQPICAIHGGSLYLADDQACRVLRIAIDSGHDEAPITLDADPGLRVKWMGLQNGRLYALLGKNLPTRGLGFLMSASNRQLRLDQAAAGQIVLAADLSTGKELWRHEEPATMDYRTIAARDGRVYLYSEQTRLACLDASGKVAWENRDRAWIDALKRPPQMRNPNIEAVSTLVVGPHQVFLSVPGAKDGFIFDAASGTLLWKDSMKGSKPMFAGGNFHGSRHGLYEPTTGERIGDASAEGSGCGIVTWVPGLEEGLGHVAMGVKSPCGVGAYAAGGALAFSSSQCDCWPHLRGAAVFTPAEGLLSHARDKADHPLRRDSAVVGSMTTAAGDWPQYRGGVRRLGSAAVEIDVSCRLRSVTELDTPLSVPDGYGKYRFEWLERPTPPVTAGGLAFYGISDGTVRAVRISTGTTAWETHVGGAVLTAPAFAGGRLYAGSADGWITCLDAATGARVWTWRGAPAESLITIYGKLMSRWPVTAVLCEGETVYGVAGQWMQNGFVTFALDASTGEPRWTTWTDPAYDGRDFLLPDEPGYGPAGYLARVGDTLWVRTYLGLPAVFQTLSGKSVPPTDEIVRLQARNVWSFGVRLATAGRDIVVVADDLVLQGGAPLLSNPDMRADKSAARFIAYGVDPNGQVPVDPLPSPAIPSSMIAPAVDGDDILIVGAAPGKSWRSQNATIGLGLWSLATWKDEYQKVIDGQDLRQGFSLGLTMDRARWYIPDIDVNAVLLTVDAALAVVGVRKPVLRRGDHVGYSEWKLVALDRATGNEKWSVSLPGEPINSGIAAAADGSFVLTLRDGSLVCAGR